MRLKLCPGPSTCPEPKEKVKSESSCDHLLCKDTGLESMGSLELSDTYLSFLPLWQAFFEAQTLSAMGLLKVGTPLHWKDSLGALQLCPGAWDLAIHCHLPQTEAPGE